MMIVSLGVHTFMHEMYRGLSSFNCSQICIRVGWNFDLCSIFVVLALQFLGGCPCVNCVNVNIEEIWNKILFKWLRNKTHAWVDTIREMLLLVLVTTLF